MHFACYSRLALGIALPSLALYLTPRTTAPEGQEQEKENIITRARQKLSGERTKYLATGIQQTPTD